MWHELYLFNNPLAIKEYSFQLYQPTKLPEGIALKQSMLEADIEPLGGKIWHPWMFWLKPYDVTFYMLTGDTIHEGIAEWNDKAPNRYTGLRPCVEQLKVDCQMRRTPLGQEYQYISGYRTLGGVMESEEKINFIKNGTFITSTFHIRDNRPIPESEWNEFIDSFTPKDPNAVPLVHASPKTASP